MEARFDRNGVPYRAVLNGEGLVEVIEGSGPPKPVRVRPLASGTLVVESERGTFPAEAVRDGDTVWVRLGGTTYRFEISRGRAGARARGTGDLSSPMPGRVQKVLVAEGTDVRAGQPLLVVEAMKMQLEIKAPRDGTVNRLRAREGDQVDAGVPLVEIEEAP